MLDLITGAYVLYGQALSDIRSELSTAERRLTDETLASMTALYMYEMLVSKTERAWMSHASGIGLLLQLRGPSLHKPADMKGIFLEHRIMLVGKSIISLQPTFLRDPIWKTVPWEDNPVSKSEIDYLVDIGADISQYNSDFQGLVGYHSQEPKYLQLVDQVANSIEELNTWWRKWETEHPYAATEVTSTANTPLFPTILEYNTLWEAFTICFHNAIRILLLQLWDVLKPFSTFHPVTLNEQNFTALLGISSDIRRLACEILRSLRYSYRMSRRFVYTFSFLVISDVTYGCFDRESSEARWISEHGWAELQSLDDIEDANLLQVLIPLGRIKIGQ
ncbi:hypothetical protein IFR05_007605 [Cadophora sp. M221]|nr:hypothetical protein IFR05_007605 [Cadophora sp. M221]